MSLTLTLKDNGGNPVSGEGTSITLNNTIEANFTKFDLYGDTEQQTYSGKNLYEGSPDFSGTWNNEASWTTSSQTYNGMVVKQRADAWAGLSKDIPVVAGKTYTFSLWAKADTARTSALYIGGGGATATVSTTGKDINLTTSWQRYFLSFSVSASGNARPRLENKTTLGTNAYICGYQIEESNSMTDYEPYVGGTASPNPDYPQEVKTVTGEQTITVSNGQGGSQVYPINLGKNILNNTGTTTTVAGGITFTVNADKSVTVSGVSTSACWFKLSESMQLDGDYFLSGCPSGGSTTTFSLQTSHSGTVFGDYGSGVQLHAGTTDSVWIVVRSGQDFSTPATFYPQIEKGTSKSSYTPYIQAFGKNLFNKYNAKTLTSCYISNDLYITDAGGSTVSICYIDCEPNTTYTVQKENTGTNNRFALFTTDSVPAVGVQALNLVGTNGAEDNHENYSITTPSGAKYLGVFFAQPTGASTPTSPEIMATIQIEKGSSATTYEPNMSGQLELCEVGDYQDYLYKSEGNWYVHKETWNYTFDGSSDEQWIRSGQSTTTNFIAGMVNLQNFAMIGGDANSGYCNYFDFATALADNKVILSGYQSGGYRFLLYRFSSGSTVTDLTSFTTWLGNHHLKMVLVLSTAADYKITYEPLIAQLEALYNTAHSYNGVTIVTSSSQYLPAIMDVTVGGSINEVIYTETELSNPLTITDIEGKSQNTTLNGNIYVDYVYNKKSFSVSIFNLKSADYATIRGFYDRQFTLNEFPLLSIPELNISEMPVFFEIGSREINSQCIVTDKLTLKFRETAQQ